MRNLNDRCFECQKCGSSQLGYQKYVKCITPVSLQENGIWEYSQSIIDEDDYLAVHNGYLCMSCKKMVEHCGVNFETENGLLDYLSLDPLIRAQHQQEYNELMCAQIEEIITDNEA